MTDDGGTLDVEDICGKLHAADLLLRSGHFALADGGRFRPLDLYPIIVRPEDVVVVYIALKANLRKQTSVAASAIPYFR